MRFVPAALAAVLFLFVSGVQARAQSADERYVQIFNWIQEADALSEHGELRQAVTRYLEAQKALKNLHSAFPGWHETVVKFRLAYLNERLDALTQKVPQTNQVAAADTNTTDTASASTNLVRQLDDEIKRLNAQNALLEAKLKEAFSVQPAAVDPRELAKAEEKIRELQKERDLLKADLERKAPALAQGTPAMEQERQLITQIKARLSEEMQKSATLALENNQLRQQLATVTAGGRGGSKELKIARSMIAALQATNTVLRSELIVMQSRMAEARGEGERPRDTASEASEELQKQLEAARARLQLYEAAPIPYTPEELAFFKQPALKVAVSDVPNNSAADPNAPGRKQREIPPGAGALLAEAQRAAETGKYEEAEQKYLQVLRQDENNVYTLANLAAVQIDLNRMDEADKNLKKALAADPRDSATLFLYGRLKFMQEKWDEALDLLSRAAAAMPDEPRTQFYLGKTLIQKGNRNQAEKVLRKAVQLKPGWGEAHYLLAVLYGTQQPPFNELAEWHYKKAIAGGHPRNAEFEKTIEEKNQAAVTRQ